MGQKVREDSEEKIFCGWKINQLIYGKRWKFCSSPIERYNPKQSLRNLQKLICPLDIIAESYSVLKQRTDILHDILLTFDTIQVPMYNRSSRSWVARPLTKLSRKVITYQESSCDAGRMLLFVVEPVFLPMGMVRHSRGERGRQRAEKIFYVRIFFDLP